MGATTTTQFVFYTQYDYPQNNTLYVHNFTLCKYMEHALCVYDSNGDGICCKDGNGFYTLKDLTHDKQIIIQGGNFGNFICHDIPAVAPPPKSKKKKTQQAHRNETKQKAHCHKTKQN